MQDAAVSASTDLDVDKFTAAVAAKCPDSMNRQDREDIAAEMMADAFRVSIDTELPLAAAAVKNKARSRYFTRGVARAARHRALLDPPGETEEDEDRAGRGDLPDRNDAMFSVEVADLIAGALTTQQRRAWLLCVDFGMTHDEAAVAMNVSAPTVREHLDNARKALRAAWEAAASA